MPNTRHSLSHTHIHTLCVIFCFHSCSMFNGFPMKIQWQWVLSISKDRSLRWSDLFHCRLLLILSFRYNWIYSKFVCKLVAMDANFVGSPSLFSHCFFTIDIYIHLQFTIHLTCLSNNARFLVVFDMHRSNSVHIFRVPVPIGENMERY